MTTKLLPCPFCGGEALLRERYVNGIANRKHYRRECRHCKATFANWYRSKKKADEAWERRTQPDMGNPATENKPLTLEELRGMDGEPVWLSNIEPCDQWAKATCVDSLAVDVALFGDSETWAFRTANYGKTWLAYRNKPKEATNDNT